MTDFYGYEDGSNTNKQFLYEVTQQCFDLDRGRGYLCPAKPKSHSTVDHESPRNYTVDEEVISKINVRDPTKM